jgi:hypothetical protein
MQGTFGVVKCREYGKCFLGRLAIPIKASNTNTETTLHRQRFVADEKETMRR